MNPLLRGVEIGLVHGLLVTGTLQPLVGQCDVNHPCLEPYVILEQSDGLPGTAHQTRVPVLCALRSNPAVTCLNVSSTTHPICVVSKVLISL